MTQRLDLHNGVAVSNALNTATIATNTTTVGNILDTKGFGSVEFVLSLGTKTDGTYTFKIEESDNSDMSSSNVAATNNVLGSLTGPTASNTNASVGYVIGSKRYIRLSVVSTLVTTGATGVTALAIFGNPNLAPI